MTTSLIYHPAYLCHDTGPHHPERPSRLKAIFRKLNKTGLMDKLMVVEPDVAMESDIAMVHSPGYINSVKDTCIAGGGKLDADTVASKDSYIAALFAAGGVMKAIDLVCGGNADNAFCAVRPPGHHAGHCRAMGFCLFNNVAIGARYVQKKYNIKRVLIIDWDAHHGNGTEEIFYEDPSVFYVSLHQYPHYPGTGSSEYRGKEKGKGYNLNIPMSAGSGDSEYMKVFRDMVIPMAKDFKPEFILISAGFDGHENDPLSSTNLTEKGYGKMTELVKDIAVAYAKGRVVSVLEGGYNLLSLADSVNTHIEKLST
ncbi:MAG: histone deacetylase [Candidatus Omnitrophica bacterium]|nr:histone deacetylase [Candidatus Omnitrophota bacterium]